MKTKVFLMSLALSCLWSCQQNESEVDNRSND